MDIDIWYILKQCIANESTLWLSTLTPNNLWYSPPNNVHGICARKQDIMNENIVIVLLAGINELEASFVLFYLTVLVYFFYVA